MRSVIHKGKLLLLLGLLGLITVIYFRTTSANDAPLSKYPIRGIDISYYQDDIDWKKLRKEDISFIYIKATEGAGRVDAKFKTNWANALKYKYRVGAYHFYIPNRTGIDQASNFIKNVPSRGMSLRPVIDLEFDIINKSNKSKKQIISEIDDFLDAIESYYDKTPILYTSISFYNYFIKGNFDKYKIWICDVSSKPRIDNDKWIIWQYTHHGRVKGIKGYVDMNALNGSLGDLD